MTDIKITSYNGSYKDQIIQLILKIQTEEFGITISIKDQPDLEKIQQFYQNDNGNFWVALYDDRVIGTAAHRFYEKNGFHEISKAALPPAFPVMTVDSKFYIYNLSSNL